MARTIGLEVHVLHASTEAELDAAFASLAQLRASALAIGNDPFFNSRSARLAALTSRHAMPAIYQYREFAAAGGLMSYGGSLTSVKPASTPDGSSPAPSRATCRCSNRPKSS